uniref:Uncharacterized protein n=1 Tax=Anguilla anguilla TaxID=7936 RepID=A0A0E9PWS8_ANGAN
MSQLPLSEKFIVDQAACANFSYRRKLITTLRSVFILHGDNCHQIGSFNLL